LLEDVKNGLLERGGVDEGVILQLDTAQKENLTMARTAYGASEKEVTESVYHGPSDKDIEEYEKRLERKGLTDEQLHQKDISIGTASVKSTPKTTKKTRKNKKEAETNVKAEETEVKPRRKRRTKKEETVQDELSDKLKEMVVDVVEDKKVDVAESEPVKINDIINKKYDNVYNVDDYDLNSIPSYVQYDMIPLPSNGECYKHKKSRVPVAYMTAADENIITAPNMYRDGKILDVILKRKILDKDFAVEDLCSGDRDAILLWLRATSYGDDFPIVASHPQTKKQYNTTIKLSDFKYNDFKLKSDKNALFEFKTSGGDVIKFKYLTHGDDMKLREEMTANTTNKTKFDILTRCKDIKELMDDVSDISDEDKDMIMEDVEEIMTITGDNFDVNYDETIPKLITGQMSMYTQSINGNTDRNYISRYIENMRVGDALAYRRFYNDNKPSVDLSITIHVPESDGGGSFNTILRIEDTIFINY
jgi:hypothetical protein